MFWLYHDGEWVVQWSNTNAYTYSIPHTCAKGNAKAAAHAVPSADALRVVKRLKELKELKSNQELARQLASSLLLGGALRIVACVLECGGAPPLLTACYSTIGANSSLTVNASVLNL
jgi:hypothetical protein